jgi:predicted secreted protein
MPRHAMGTRLRISGNFIAGLTSVSGLELSADTIDVTTLESANNFREFIQGMRDGGEVSVSGFFEPGDTNGQVQLNTLFNSGNVTAFSILFPSAMGAEWTFNGIVTGVTTGAEMEEAVTFEATIKVTGAPNLGLTASAGLSALSFTGTGGTLTPTFANNRYFYTFSGVTGASATVTATAANHTLQLFVDGAFVQTLTSGSASSAIALTLSVGRLVTITAQEAGKTTIIYEAIIVKTA